MDEVEINLFTALLNLNELGVDHKSYWQMLYMVALMFMQAKWKNPTETSVIQRQDWTLKYMNHLQLTSRNMLNLVINLSD